MRTSYSAIETYLQCPQRYKFQEIDKIRAPKSREAIFGSLVHQTLKFMFRSDPLFPTLDEVIGYFREHWPSPDIFAKETEHDPLKRPWTDEENRAYFEEGVRMLKRFYEKNAPWNFIIVDLESRFEVVLADEKTNESHVLAGIIDRIDKLPDGTYEIIDYKTAKRMPSQDSLGRNLQLSLYSLGLQKRWPHINSEDITLSLYFLKHGEKLSTVANREGTERTQQHILQTIRNIQKHVREKKVFEPLPGPLCNWCPYKPMCPAWKHLYRGTSRTIHSTSHDEINATIKEYFELKKASQKNDERIAELQAQIKKFMEQEGVTRVFGDGGTIAKKTVQRYEYDFEKIRSILSPLGRWEDTLKLDETKLRRILAEVPENLRDEIQNARRVSKEYTVLSASTKFAEVRSP